MAQTAAQPHARKVGPSTQDGLPLSDVHTNKGADGSQQITIGEGVTQALAEQARAPKPSAPRPVTDLSDDELEAESARLTKAGDFGDRYDAILDEMDRRDAETGAEQGLDLPQGAPAAMQKAYQDRLTDLIEADSRANSGGKTVRQLREEYDAYAHMQWLAAEQATRGNLKSNPPPPWPKNYAVEDLFNGRMTPAQIRKYATPELMEWLGSNPRLSFDEWRGASTRARGRTMGEWG